MERSGDTTEFYIDIPVAWSGRPLPPQGLADHRQHQQQQKDHEQDLGNTGGGPGNTGKSKNPRNKGQDQKYQRPTKHDREERCPPPCRKPTSLRDVLMLYVPGIFGVPWCVIVENRSELQHWSCSLHAMRRVFAFGQPSAISTFPRLRTPNARLVRLLQRVPVDPSHGIHQNQHRSYLWKTTLSEFDWPVAARWPPRRCWQTVTTNRRKFTRTSQARHPQSRPIAPVTWFKRFRRVLKPVRFAARPIISTTAPISNRPPVDTSSWNPRRPLCPHSTRKPRRSKVGDGVFSWMALPNPVGVSAAWNFCQLLA